MNTKELEKQDTTCSPTGCEETSFTSAVKPKYDVNRTESSWELEIEVPGAKKGDVSVDYDDSVLDIKARRSDSVPEGWRPIGYSVPKSDYRLKLEVTEAVDADKITASMEDGILRLSLPLSEAVKPRTIAVT